MDKNKPVATPEDFEALQLANVALEDKVTVLTAQNTDLAAKLDGANATFQKQNEYIGQLEAERDKRKPRMDAVQPAARSLEAPRSDAPSDNDPSNWKLDYPITLGGKTLKTADLTADVVKQLRDIGTSVLVRK